jgi:Raf kinase inhibitor-like YbhB/YbcL family protein
VSCRSQPYPHPARLWLVAALLTAGASIGANGCSSSGSTPADRSGSAGTSGSAGVGAAGSQAGGSGSGAAGSGAAGTGAAGTGVAGTGAAGTAGGAAGTTGAAGSKTDGGTDAAVDKPASEGGTKTDAAGTLMLTTTSLKMMGADLVFPAASSAPMNQSPALAWTGVPAGTLSFAVSMYDATAKNTHWIIWDIAPAEMGLPANLPRGMMPAMLTGATQKSAFGGMPGYEGPGGGTVNNYEIELWALKVAALPAGTANMTLNAIHSTLLPAQKIESAQILAKGTRNGL